MAISFSKFFQKIKSKKILILVLIFLGVGIVGFVVYMSIILARDNGIKIDSSMITNVTDSSFTVVWQTSEECVGSVLLSERGDNFGIVDIYNKKVKTFYDDRDIVEIGNNEYERKSGEEIKRRYTHHVTIKGLDSGNTYYFRIMNGVSIKELELSNIVTLEVSGTMLEPDVMYASVFDNEGKTFGDDSVIIVYAKKMQEVLPISAYTNSNGTFTLDVSMVRDIDGGVIGPMDDYKEQIFVWSKFGELIKVVDSNYDQPVGSKDRPGERLQYGLDAETYNVMNKSWISEKLVSKVYAGAAAPACSAGDSTDQVYGDCCGGGKAREIRRCVDVTTGTYYYHFSDCVHDAPQCNGGETGEKNGSNNTGGGGLDSVCNNNGSRDCQGYSTDNCEAGVDCGNSVCGSCASKPNGGLPDNCENGVKDVGIEEGVDCGGSCPSCPEPSLVVKKSQACPPSGCVARTKVTKEIVGIQEKELVYAEVGGGGHIIIEDVDWGGYGLYCIRDDLYYCNSQEECILRIDCGDTGCDNLQSGKNDHCKNLDNSETILLGDSNLSIPANEWGGVGLYCNQNDLITCVGTRTQNRCNFVKNCSTECEMGVPGITAKCKNEAPVIVDYGQNVGSYGNEGEMCTIIDGKRYVSKQGPGGDTSHSRICAIDVSTVTGVNLAGTVPDDCNSCNNTWQRAYGCKISFHDCNVVIGHVNYTEGTCDNACDNYKNTGVLPSGASGSWRDGTPYAPHLHYEVVGAGPNCELSSFPFPVFPCNSQPVGVNNSASGGLVNRTYAEFVNTKSQNGTNSDLTLFERYLQAESDNYVEPGIYQITDSTISTDTVTITTGYEKMLYFDDQNDNGVLDEGENFLTEDESANLTIELNKISEIEWYKLKTGWNLIGVNTLLDTPDGSNRTITASELAEIIAQNGGYISQIAKYDSSGFAVYTTRFLTDDLENQSFGEDFKIFPGMGLFIKSYNEFEFFVSGKRVDGALEVDLNPGWNLVGIYNSEKESYQALDVLKDMQSKEIPADIFTKWENSRYYSVIYEDNTMYGNDFKVYPQVGYWIRINGENDKKYTPD